MKVYIVAVLLCCVSSLTSGGISKKTGASGKQLGNLAAGLPNLSFQVPALGLFANSNNGINVFGIGGKSTVTRTIVQTVTTVVVPSYRTCTTSAAALMPCAGRRKRSAAPGDAVEPTPSIEIHIGKTKIVDPSAVSEILHLKTPYGYQEDDEADETAGVTSKSVAEDVAATALYPSEDVSGVTADDDLLRAGVTTTLGSVSDDDVAGVTTSGVAAVAQEQEEEEDDEEESDPARAGLRGAVTTVTTTIPVTAIASTPVTVAMSSLTIMYAGCSPPGPLPISTSLCV